MPTWDAWVHHVLATVPAPGAGTSASSGAALMAAAEAAERAGAALAAAKARFLAAAEQVQAGMGEGARSAAELFAERTHTSTAAAARIVKAGDDQRRVPKLGEAFARGEVGQAQFKAAGETERPAAVQTEPAAREPRSSRGRCKAMSCRPPSCVAWPARQTSSRSSWARSRRSWTSVGLPGSRRRRNARPLPCGIAAVCSRGVTRRRSGATSITSARGNPEARPTWTTSSCSVPHHHGGCEPDPAKPPQHNWEIRLESGVAILVPPLRVDRERRPRRHERFVRTGGRVDVPGAVARQPVLV